MENGVKMYGAFWCPHCIDQKELFEDAKDLIPYVECTEEKEVCQREGISGYPTWKFTDGTSLSGSQSLSLLAQKSDCAY
jgi:glutaredoxin